MSSNRSRYTPTDRSPLPIYSPRGHDYARDQGSEGGEARRDRDNYPTPPPAPLKHI